LHITITETTTGQRERIAIPVLLQNNGFGGAEVNVTVDGTRSSVPSGTVLVATTTRGGTVTTAASRPTVGEGDQALGVIRITEVGVTGFANGANPTTITLTLPQNVTWEQSVTPAGGTTTNFGVSFLGGFNVAGNFNGETNGLNLGAAAVTGGWGTRELTLVVPNWGTPRLTSGLLQITTPVNVGTRASMGDIDVRIRAAGAGNITTDTVTIGVLADYTVTLAATDEFVLVSGQVEQEAGTLTIRESIAGALIGNRNLEITMPRGVKVSEARITVTRGNVGVNSLTIIPEGTTDDFNRILIPVGQASSSASTIEVEFRELDIAPDFVGDIVVQVAGRAGVSGEVVIGNVLQALTPVESRDEVRIGFQNQKVADFVFTEAQAEAVLAGEIVIVAPPGVTFSSVNRPIVEVTEGNMDLRDNSVRIDNRTNALIFEVDTASTRASEITISNIFLNVDRTVPVGPMVFDVHGADRGRDWSPLSWVADDRAGGIADSYDGDATNRTRGFNSTLAFSFIGANCVTPAPFTVTGVSQFVIGSTTYTFNDAEMTMPTAPYIRDNRTFLPVRFAAMAMGVAEQNIIWDNENRTVTLMKDGVVVQLTIDSRVMRVNGADITLDVAPEITNNFTMLPIGVIAQAFGYTAAWDAATQTVTISPQAQGLEV
jgi:hypothetical protein